MVSKEYIEKLLFHVGKGIWKGIPVIGPIVEEVVYEAHKDILVEQFQEACSSLSNEDLNAIDDMLNKASAAIEDALTEFSGKIAKIDEKIEQAEGNIRSDIDSLKGVIETLRLAIEQSKDESTRSSLASQLAELEQRREEWISRLSSSQKVLLATIPQSKQDALVRTKLFQTAEERSAKLRQARYEELNFRLHELRWLGLIDRERKEDKETQRLDWHYWRTKDGTQLLSSQDPI